MAKNKSGTKKKETRRLAKEPPPYVAFTVTAAGTHTSITPAEANIGRGKVDLIAVGGTVTIRFTRKEKPVSPFSKGEKGEDITLPEGRTTFQVKLGIKDNTKFSYDVTPPLRPKFTDPSMIVP